LEAWWEEFTEDHADEIARMPKERLERFKEQASGFIVRVLRMSDAEKRDYMEQY